MSSEFARAILKHYHPVLIARKAQELIEREWVKGCTPWIAPNPVELEPPYTALAIGAIDHGEPLAKPWIEAEPEDPRDWQRVQIWVSPEQEGDWGQHSERFLKQLGQARHRVAMELLGHADRVDQLLLFHAEDGPVVRTAFAGEFKRCQLTPARWVPHGMCHGPPSTILRFRDFLPSPPYSRLLTRPDELRESVYGSVVSALAGLPREAFGLLQVVFQPARPEHNWHDNVKRLIDIEYELKQVLAWQGTHTSAHHLPSGYISSMADALIAKAHNDKPFFFAALRLAIGGTDDTADANMAALGAFVGLIQYGGRPLESLTETHYLQVVRPDQLADNLAFARTCRPGFLVNSDELTALVQVCPPAATEFRPRPLQPLETLAPSPELTIGVPIGVCEQTGTQLPVCIPLDARCKHTHVIGRPGTGKSSLLENMVLAEMSLGHGVAVLDPHGALVERLLDLIPAEHANRVIYVNPADPLYVPSWNPFHSGADHDPGRVASDLVNAVHSIVDGWGERLAHLLRHAFFALLHVPGACLLDVADLLRKGTPASDAIIRLITSSPMTNDLARRFWTEDFPGYGKDDLRPPQHKLSKLLVGGTVSLMLSQPDSRINLRNVMDEGKALLVNLSELGADARDTLGCFMLSLLHLTALGRLKGPQTVPKPFHIYCDDAHRFLTESAEDLIAETRKFGVSLTLAHQFMGQFAARKVSALSSVASTIIFNVDEKDAEYLRKDLVGRVAVKDIITQGVGQAIARVSTRTGTEIVRVRTLGPREVPKVTCRDAIIAQSRRLYCDPVEEVQRQIAARADVAQNRGHRRTAPPRTRRSSSMMSFDGPQSQAASVLHQIQACMDALPWQDAVDEVIRDTIAQLGKGQCPSTSRALIEHVARTIRVIRARIPSARGYLGLSTALDEAAYLIGLSFGNSPSAGFDAALPSVTDRSTAGLETLYLALGETLKERFRRAQVNWAFARHLDPTDWETNRAVAELLLGRLSASMPDEAPPLRPEMFVDSIPDLFARVQEIENSPLSVLLNRFPPSR